MKKNQLTKVLSLAALTVLSLGVFTGCGQDARTIEEIKESGKIVMGTNAAFPPFEEIQGTEIVGFDPEIGKLIAEELGVELEIMDMEFGQLMGAVDGVKIDFVAAGMTANEERAKQVDFSESYFQSKQVIIVKEGEAGIASADDLVGKKVGVQLGTTGDLFVSGTEGIEVVQYDKGALAVADLANGKVDAVVLDEEPAKLIAANQQGVVLIDAPFIEESYAIAVRKGNADLKAVIDGVLAEIQIDGTYDALYTEFFGTIE